MNPEQVPTQDPTAPATPPPTDTGAPSTPPETPVPAEGTNTTVEPMVAPETTPAPVTNEQPLSVSPAPADPMANGQPPVVTAVTPEHHSDTLGIVSIIFAFFSPLIGLILGIIGMKKAKEAGHDPKLSKIGTILSSVFLVLGTLFFILYIFVIAASVSTTTTGSL